ncbi:MAG: sugar ABC transporter ATP-binding protein [Ruminiclostridium sp.]
MGGRNSMLLQLKGINKIFYGVKVLSNVDFEIEPSETHAIIGLNGAGKSTLINIISGVYIPDAGEIIINGEKVKISSPFEAQKLGIETIHQEPILVPTLSIAENIFIGRIPKKFKIFINNKKMVKETAKILRLLGWSLDPYTKAGKLSLNEQFIVSVARSFIIKPKILILDEPTAGLSEKESSLLFDLISNLKKHGTGIIYITHRLDELSKICDRITILKDGEKVVTCNKNSFSQEELVKKMCGREMIQYFPPINKNFGEEILRVDSITKGDIIKDVNLVLKEGEILGIAGLIGSGRSALAKTMFGELKRDSGQFFWRGKCINIKHPQQAIKKGLGYINENRVTSGLFMDMGASENLTISSLRKFNFMNIIQLEEEQNAVLEKVIDLDIKLQYLNQQVKYLSGGNQQKVLLGRWMLSESDLYILDEPTRGIDVASKSDIYIAIRELADRGKGIIVISSEIQELIGLCSKIMVMNHGRVVDEMDSDNVSEERIIKSMTGR